MQPDRSRVASYWLAAGEQDLRLVRAHAADEPNAACFHAQQSAEKSLKALLVGVAGDVARTHVAAELIEELREANVACPEPIRMAAVTLDRYYAQTRYPDALGDADPTRSFFEADARAAAEMAERVVSWVRGALNVERDEPSGKRPN